jgi:hypothetical protein
MPVDCEKCAPIVVKKDLRQTAGRESEGHYVFRFGPSASPQSNPGTSRSVGVDNQESDFADAPFGRESNLKMRCVSLWRTRRQQVARSKRLLKYWNGLRCCRIWGWPRRKRSADIHAISAQRGRRGDPASPTFGATLRARGRRCGWPRRLLVAAHRGDAPRSLVAIHPFCLYARAAPVFQQSPKPLLLDQSGFLGSQTVLRYEGFAVWKPPLWKFGIEHSNAAIGRGGWI